MKACGTCMICRKPILPEEGTGVIGSFLVFRDGFQRFEQYRILGHDYCADSLLSRLGLGPADSEQITEDDVREAFASLGMLMRRTDA